MASEWATELSVSTRPFPKIGNALPVKGQSMRRQRQVQWISILCKEAQHPCIGLARRSSNHDELRRIAATFSDMCKDQLSGCPCIFNQRPRRREQDVASFVVNGAET